MYFQYEISFAAYCFSWWEKILVHIILLSALALVTWGTWRFGILGTLQLIQSTGEQLQTFRQEYSGLVPQIRRYDFPVQQLPMCCLCHVLGDVFHPSHAPHAKTDAQ
jgi:hypothetical protein